MTREPFPLSKVSSAAAAHRKMTRVYVAEYRSKRKISKGLFAFTTASISFIVTTVGHAGCQRWD